MEKTAMLHVWVDNELKSQASEMLKEFGLSLSDAVRILLTRIVKEKGLPVSLIADENAYDAWFKIKVHEALQDNSPLVANDNVMSQIQLVIDRNKCV